MTVSSKVNTAKAAKRVIMTLPGIANSLELDYGLKPTYNTATTINNILNVFPTVIPTIHPITAYYGIGIGGDTPSGTSNIMNPVEVSSTNLNLYKPIPFRMVPIEQDLASGERANYRMRTIEEINGQQYISYYLKKILISDAQVQYSKYDPSTKADQPYTIDPSQLRPTPPATPVDGSTTNITEEITAYVNGTLPILGSEIVEVINAKYGGDMRLGRISELGIFTGTDMQQQATDSTGASFSYTEAIFAQLAQHHTFLGRPFEDDTSVWEPTIKFTSGNMSISENDLSTQ